MTATSAAEAVEQANRAEGKPLDDVIELAFQHYHAQDYEVDLIRLLASMPGAPFEEISKIYKRRDISLIVGHLVYDRFGFFRHLLHGLPDQSSLLIHKERRDGRLTYQLRAEAVSAFRRLGILV